MNRIRDSGGGDKVHVIGFSLGAQVANWLSNSLKPDYLLPRITGELLQLHNALSLLIMFIDVSFAVQDWIQLYHSLSPPIKYINLIHLMLALSTFSIAT